MRSLFASNGAYGKIFSANKLSTRSSNWIEALATDQEVGGSVPPGRTCRFARNIFVESCCAPYLTVFTLNALCVVWSRAGVKPRLSRSGTARLSPQTLSSTMDWANWRSG